jgi:transcription-repair coupling factor (superfamily II helicase)
MDIGLDPARPTRRGVAGLPAGHDAAWLARAAREAGAAGLLHVAEGRRRLRQVAACAAFFDPEVEILALPPWDCLPYDRVSPSAAVSAERTATLARLLEPAARPRLVLTSVFGLLRRLPRRRDLSAAIRRLRLGDPVDEDALERFLLASGYLPAEALAGPGDFLRRSNDDRVELWPPGAPAPLRLDMPGGTLAAIRLGEETAEEIAIPPLSEVTLDGEAARRFLGAYGALFGVEAERDPLAAAVAAGRRHAGMEHWLPLFLDGTETLFDWMPGAPVALDPGVEDARAARLAELRGAHDGRRGMDALSARGHVPVYRPVPPEAAFLTTDDWETALEGRAVLDLDPGPAERGEPDAGGRPGPDLSGGPGALAEHLARRREEGRPLVLAAETEARRAALVRRLPDGLKAPALSRFDPALALSSAVLPLDRGFVAPGVAVATRGDLLGRREEGRRPAALLDPGAMPLRLGDLVVHADHGIGLCDGLEAVDAGGAPHACVRLLYKDNDRLYVPVENLDLLWRFGQPTEKTPLDRLGGQGWGNRLARTVGDLMRAAETLVATQARREAARVRPVAPEPRAWRRFVDRFPHAETDDQQRAIDDVLADLASGRLMDRLVVGDVGFGKTEVALRAAFAVASSGRQVAVVAPTLPLARQHLRDFSARLAGFGIEVAEVTRAGGAAGAGGRAAKAAIREGRARVVVGTHALLGAGVRFRDLGLLVVDEEQRFGVAQKERLKELARDVHVLTMSATPIPRTMQLAMAGIRDLSVIATPPVERRPVRTRVVERDGPTVRDALMRERGRGGQSFYVCPRLSDLDTLRAWLAELVPDLRVAVAHGKMAPEEMDEAITGFAEGGADVLLATNIIESGLNIPAANTLVVHRADMFGLAQLYQLRGRVGRGAQRAVCLLTTEPGKRPTAEAARRLRAVAELADPGSGFELASRDMDLRGAGNLLGEEQSGHLREVGAELFQELLGSAVAAATAGGAVEPPWAPRINLDLPVLIPEDYVRDLNERLALYRAVARLEGAREAEALAEEIEARHGSPPPELRTLLALPELKRLCRRAGVEQLDLGPRGALVGFREGTAAAPSMAEGIEGARVRPDGRVAVAFAEGAGGARLAAARRLLEGLAAARDAGAAPPRDEEKRRKAAS